MIKIKSELVSKWICLTIVLLAGHLNSDTHTVGSIHRHWFYFDAYAKLSLGEVGLNLALGQVTSCCDCETAWLGE